MAEISETRVAVLPSEEYLSEEYPIVANMTLAVNHGLADDPRLVWLVLKCITAEQGYAVGDHVDYPAFTYTSATTATTVAHNKTQIKLYMIGLPNVVNVSGDTAAVITAANWTLKIRARL
jgi:hypothetical protein